MFDKLVRALKSMELEEQILHAGLLCCAIGIFLPWFGGQWFGNDQLWNGFGFYTAYLGIAVFLMQLFIIFMSLSPLLGGPIIVRRQHRMYVRLILCAASVLLLIAAFSVLLRVTFDMAGSQIRWGIYISMIGSAVALLYAFIRHQQQVRNQVHELFHHPDERMTKRETASLPETENPLPPPPPPPPTPPEDHHLYTPKL